MPRSDIPKGSFSTSGIVLTSISIAFIIIGAILTYIYIRRRRSYQSAECATTPREIPRESRIKSLWILANRHRRIDRSDETQSIPVHRPSSHWREKSFATSSSKGDDAVEIHMDNERWAQAQAWPIASDFDRSHGAVSISIDDTAIRERNTSVVEQKLMERSVFASQGSSSCEFEETLQSSGSLYPRRPPLAAQHSGGSSTLSIPRIVIGGSASPTSDSFSHRSRPARPAPLSRHPSEVPSLAPSVPRTVTPSEELGEDELMPSPR